MEGLLQDRIEKPVRIPTCSPPEPPGWTSKSRLAQHLWSLVLHEAKIWKVARNLDICRSLIRKARLGSRRVVQGYLYPLLTWQ